MVQIEKCQGLIKLNQCGTENASGRILDSLVKIPRPNMARLVNVGTVVTEQAFIGGSTFLTMVLVKRACGESQLGVFSLALTLLYLLMAIHESLITLPFTVYGNRLKGDAKRTYLGNSLLQHIILCATVFAGLSIAGLIIGGFSTQSLLVPILISVGCIAPLWLSREFVRRVSLSDLQLQQALAVSAMYGVLLALFLIYLLQSNQLTPTTCFLAMGVASVVPASWWLYRNRTIFRIAPSTLLNSVKKNWFLGKWMVAGQTTTALGGSSVPWILALYSGTVAVGVLAACDSVLRLANPLMKAVHNVMVPKASLAAVDGGRNEVVRVLWRAAAGLALFMSIFFVGIVFAGGWFLEWIYGPDLEPYRHCLTILACSQWFATLTMPAGCGILIFERSDLNLRNDVVGVVITFVSAAILCYFFGVYGAATGMVLGNAAKCLLTYGTFHAIATEHHSLAV